MFVDFVEKMFPITVQLEWWTILALCHLV